MKTLIRVAITTSLVAGLSACATASPDTQTMEQNIASAESGAFGECIEHAYLAGMRLDEAKFMKAKIDNSVVTADKFVYSQGDAAAKKALEQRRLAERVCQEFLSTQFSRGPAATPKIAGSTEVFFELGSATLTDAERVKIEQVVERYKKSPATEVVLTGRTDTTGSEGFNKALSTKRATAVFDELKKAARQSNVTLPPQRIEVIGAGEVNGPENTASRSDRRVEITLIP